MALQRRNERCRSGRRAPSVNRGGPPLPDAMKPSLRILISSFAAANSAYTATASQADLFAEAL